MLALFGAPPPQATQTLPRLSLCLHACADTASDDYFPLPLLSLSSPGTSTRSAASGIGGGGGGDGGGDDDNDGG